MQEFNSGSAFARALNRVLADGQFTAVELAEVAGVSDRLVGYVRTGEKSMPVSAAERVSRYLCEHGEVRVALAFLCPRYAIAERPSGTSNGCVKDELVSIVRAMADADAAHGQRDRQSMRSAIRALRAALSDLEAEADALDA